VTHRLPHDHPVLDPWPTVYVLPPDPEARAAALVAAGDWNALAQLMAAEDEHAHRRPRWRCANRLARCQDPGIDRGWWKSVHGTVHCLHCVPPAFPELVAAQGTAANAPHVEDPGP
jgi:hypothetical protein